MYVKMLKLTFLLLLSVVCLQAKMVLNLTRDNTVKTLVNPTEDGIEPRYLFGGAFVTQAERDTMKFVAYVFEKSSRLALTMGVVVNKVWIITPSVPVETKAPSALGVTVCGGPSLTDPGGITRRVKENVKNPDCAANPLIDCVSLLRICPSITPDHAATLVPSISPYRDPTIAVNIVVYQVDELDNSYPTKLYKATKNIGEICECDGIANFVLDHHVCLINHATIYAGIDPDYSDMPGYIVMDSSTNEVIGFLVEIQNDVNGEIVLLLESVRTFIDNTAIIPLL